MTYRKKLLAALALLTAISLALALANVHAGDAGGGGLSGIINALL